MNFFQNMSIAAKISTGFISILALMAITSIIVYLSVSSITASSHWVNHTYEVIHNAESVGAAMVDMETGQRGFLITGKDEYLQPYNVGVAAFKQLITKGQKLTSDNPIQGKRWQEVYKLQSQWLEETAEPEIAARRQVTLGLTPLLILKRFQQDWLVKVFLMIFVSRWLNSKSNLSSKTIPEAVAWSLL
jgi:methyl-accepting chemotaxis protein